MFKWEKESDAEKAFINQTLESILFSQNTMSLHFENKSSITVYSGFELFLEKGYSESIVFPISNTNIISLIGERVTKIKIINQTDLLLNFLKGNEIKILGSNTAYECYVVRIGEKEIII